MSAILLVEDEDAIAVAFRAAVDEVNIPVVVDRVSDAEKALKYLHASPRRPDVVFLDLNMPKADGWEALKAMKADDRLCHVPVVIFTSSSRRSDKEQAYALGAQHFLTKPATFSGLVVEIEMVCRKYLNGNGSQAQAGG